jgi:hypothetical protein
MNMDEQLLLGGRSTKGVVRVGETVHRPRQENSDFVKQLLFHLEQNKFSGAPHYQGLDEKGRECFTFIPGYVPPELDIWSEDQLRSAAMLIRSYHDATIKTGLNGSEEIVCHGDLSPCNTVFVDALPFALIDFDTAAPGTREEDLGYALWLWIDVGNPKIEPLIVGERLAIFAETYGFEKTRIIPAVLRSQKRISRKFNETVSSSALARRTFDWAERSIIWVLANRKLVEQVIFQ